MPDRTCPHCGSETKQVKAGLKRGVQQYLCGTCRRRYVDERRGRGYSADVKQQAALLRGQGHTLREIEASLGVSSRTLIKWFHKAEPDKSPAEEVKDLPAKPAETVVKKRATIHDVAERAGVAPSTVSNYLNGKMRMSEATQLRIRGIIEELYFTPNALTRAIRKGRSRIIGVHSWSVGDFEVDLGQSLLPPVIAGINAGAKRAAHDILLYTTRPEDGYGGIRFLDGHVDGVIVIGYFGEQTLERTAAAGLPIVALLNREVPASCGYVQSDNIAAIRSVVTHLISLGRTRIGYYGFLHDSDHVDRYDGFCSAMTEAGLAWDETLMMHPVRKKDLGQGGWPPKKYQRGLIRLIDRAHTLDAMIIPAIVDAEWAISELKRRGLRVPEDVAVVGFDDVPNAAAAGITVIRQPFRQIGQVGVERLLALIEGEAPEHCRVTLPAELIVRRSTVGDAR